MKLKKFLGFGLTFVVASLATVAVQAATATYKAVSKVSADGKTVTMTVNVSGTTSKTQVNGYAVKLSYDPDVLEPKMSGKDATGSDCYATTAISGDNGVLVADVVDVDGDSDATKAVAVGWAAAEPVVVGTGTDVATVTFSVKEKKDTTVGVDVVAYASDANTIVKTSEVDAASGAVKFALLGDVDTNNKVTATDASLILQHELGTIVLDGAGLANADVDANNKVTATDASLILQYELGTISAFPAETKK